MIDLNQNRAPSVVIVGGGPAGCTLACLLAQRGFKCVLFDDNKRPSLLVGESLVPAVIPLLRKIGVEEDIAKISQLKPGACFRHENGFRVDIRFRAQGQHVPDYAYNIPRPQFDHILMNRARALGVKVVAHRAKLVRGNGEHGPEVLLCAESLAAAKMGKQQADLLVDASGRHRLLSRLLNLSVTHGKRDDVAYFAHYHNFKPDSDIDGQIVITVLQSGWSWQIPLKDRLSVGVVLDKSVAAQLGGSPEQRLEHCISTSPLLRAAGKDRQRISPVMSYGNYPIISQRAYGNGWVLLGDAMGFTDPMLSPGVFMALKAAEILDKHLAANTGPTNALQRYQCELQDWHSAWSELIEYFYDGRLLALSDHGSLLSTQKPKMSLHNLLQWMTKRSISSMVAGVTTRSSLRRAFFKNTCQSVLKEQVMPDRFKVRV